MPSDPASDVPYPTVDLSSRTWPSRTITTAPAWCAVDLRDGNQALIEPMGPERKRKMFDLLVEVGFKEIEVGFPSASQTDYDFLRLLIEENLIPDDVTIQVLTQARDELIERTFEAIAGAKRVNVHLYNSTSTLQRRVVFREDREGIKAIAVHGAELIRRFTEKLRGTEIVHQYSPESFTGTELDFSVEICVAVMDVWRPTPSKKMILNLAATVEMSTANVYADQIEWFHRAVRDRDSVIISLHPHNDRGTAVAATELGLMAGAQRVEGTLFGNGERTGNVDIVTLALNMFSQGVDPELDFSDIGYVVSTVEECNQLPVHPRHPYAGELVYTAFSGSHQDAINKGFTALRETGQELWEVPYLPIDPKDVGRSYEAVIRLNSQSGKGGMAYVLAKDHGLELPRNLQIEFSKIVQGIVDQNGSRDDDIERELLATFTREYLREFRARCGSPTIISPIGTESSWSTRRCARRQDAGGASCSGAGNGPIDAFVRRLWSRCSTNARYGSTDYHEHAVSAGSDAVAVCYVAVEAFGATTLEVARHAEHRHRIAYAGDHRPGSAILRQRRAPTRLPSRSANQSAPRAKSA